MTMIFAAALLETLPYPKSLGDSSSCWLTRQALWLWTRWPWPASTLDRTKKSIRLRMLTRTQSPSNSLLTSMPTLIYISDKESPVTSPKKIIPAPLTKEWKVCCKEEDATLMQPGSNTTSLNLDSFASHFHLAEREWAQSLRTLPDRVDTTRDFSARVLPKWWRRAALTT